MEFRTTSIKRALRRCAGATLIEMMFSMGVAGIVLTAVASFSYYSGRSLAAIFNYVDLDHKNRVAIDQLTRDIRQANRLTAYSYTGITLEDAAGQPLSYVYSPFAKTLTRTAGGVSRVYLYGCDSILFDIRQRNPVGGSWDVYPTATVDTCKLINVRWVCSRKILGNRLNTESVQTARIVIRKQGT